MIIYYDMLPYTCAPKYKIITIKRYNRLETDAIFRGFIFIDVFSVFLSADFIIILQTLTSNISRNRLIRILSNDPARELLSLGEDSLR